MVAVVLRLALPVTRDQAIVAIDDGHHCHVLALQLAPFAERRQRRSLKLNLCFALIKLLVKKYVLYITILLNKIFSRYLRKNCLQVFIILNFLFFI